MVDAVQQRLEAAERRLSEVQREAERMAAELQLSQRLEAVGQLAAGVAHEINTPTQYVMDNTRFLAEAFADLAAVLAAADALADAVRAGGPASGPLTGFDAARRSADVDYLLGEIPSAIGQSLDGLRQVATIVRAMKDFSHPGGGELAPTDLRPLLETSVVISRNETKYVADVHTQVDDGLDAVPCLEGPLKQVVLNLLVNAAHAIRDRTATDGGRGRIDVRARRVGDVARIEVADTGTGIPESARDKVFDLFFTTKEVGRGTGQGLALAHRVVVDEHGGRIGFDTALGVGTTFWIELPLR